MSSFVWIETTGPDTRHWKAPIFLTTNHANSLERSRWRRHAARHSTTPTRPSSSSALTARARAAASMARSRWRPHPRERRSDSANCSVEAFESPRACPSRSHAQLRHQRNTSSSHACLTAAAADLAFISPAPLSPWQRRASRARAAPYGRRRRRRREESTQDEAWPRSPRRRRAAGASRATPRARERGRARGRVLGGDELRVDRGQRGRRRRRNLRGSCSATRPTQTSPPPTPRSTTRWMTRIPWPSPPAAAPLRPAAARVRGVVVARPRARGGGAAGQRQARPLVQGRRRYRAPLGVAADVATAREAPALAAARRRVRRARRRRRRRRRRPRAGRRRRRALCAAHEAVETSLGAGRCLAKGSRRTPRRQPAARAKRRSPAHETHPAPDAGGGAVYTRRSLADAMARATVCSARVPCTYPSIKGPRSHN